MQAYGTILSAVLPIFFAVGTGAVLRWKKILSLEADHSLMQMGIYVLYPCLMIDSLLGNPALDHLQNLLIAPLVGLATVALGYLIGYLIISRTEMKTSEKRAFSFTLGMYNYGYLPIPLTMLLFNRETLGVLLVHNLGVEIAMWGVGVVILTGAFNRDALKKCLNPPIIALVLTIIVNALGLAPHTPQFAITTFHILGQCAIPLALIQIGAVAVDFMSEFRGKGNKRIITLACSLRLLLLPLIFLSIAKWLPCSKELKQVIILEAAMPSAVFPIIMTKHYGADVPTALRVVLGTSFVSLLTIPLWIHWGLQWVFS
jgi:malate permease and related proteins